MVELHNNFTIDDSKAFPAPASLPKAPCRQPQPARDHRDHAGITKWSEVGFYIFTAVVPGEASTYHLM